VSTPTPEPGEPAAEAPEGTETAEAADAAETSEAIEATPVGESTDAADTTDAADAADAADATVTTRRPPPPKVIATVGTLLVIMVIMNWVGDALTTTWAEDHPAWLIALNSRNRILVLTTNNLGPFSYYGIGTARLLLSDPLFFLLGYWYGDAAIVWMEKRTQTWGQMLRQLEGWFSKAAYPLVFLAPNNPICLFAGAAGMPLRAFVALNVSGTIARLWVIRVFGDIFDKPIDGLLDWFAEYRIQLLAASVGLLLLSILLEFRKGETEITSYSRLDDELEAAAKDEEER
jgi:membrane protein DedA with SNARE-associated domain